MLHGRTLFRQRKVVTEGKERTDEDNVSPGLPWRGQPNFRVQTLVVWCSDV